MNRRYGLSSKELLGVLLHVGTAGGGPLRIVLLHVGAVGAPREPPLPRGAPGDRGDARAVAAVLLRELLGEGAQLGGSLRLAALVYEPNERLLEWLIQALPLGIDGRSGLEQSLLNRHMTFSQNSAGAWAGVLVAILEAVTHWPVNFALILDYFVRSNATSTDGS